jgi:hypothetical protein
MGRPTVNVPLKIMGIETKVSIRQWQMSSARLVYWQHRRNFQGEQARVSTQHFFLNMTLLFAF